MPHNVLVCHNMGLARLSSCKPICVRTPPLRLVAAVGKIPASSPAGVTISRPRGWTTRRGPAGSGRRFARCGARPIDEGRGQAGPRCRGRARPSQPACARGLSFILRRRRRGAGRVRRRPAGRRGARARIAAADACCGQAGRAGRCRGPPCTGPACGRPPQSGPAAPRIPCVRLTKGAVRYRATQAVTCCCTQRPL